MGFIGHALKDGIQYGNISWAWVFASAITGLVIGLFNKKYDVTTGKFSLMSMIWFNLAQALLPLLVIDSNSHKPGHIFMHKVL